MNIFASKLYRASSRKEDIKSAIENPVNTELVQQLRSYLDDEYLTTKYFPQDKSETQPNQKDTLDSPDDEMGPGGLGPHSAGSGALDVDFDEADGEEDLDDLPDEELGELDELDENIEELGEDIEESTNINSATALYTPPQSDTDIFPGVIQQIKGTLNSRQDTCGVDNIFVKDKEFWIYYNDSVNLNNVMSIVIEILNSLDFYYLTFNRLARKDNAMVFDITLSDAYVKPIEEQEDVKE